MTRKEIIFNMFCTQYDILQADIDEMQRNLRYRQVCTMDCVELIITKEKFEYLRDMSKWIFQILRIDEEKTFEKMYQDYLQEQKNKITF